MTNKYHEFAAVMAKGMQESGKDAAALLVETKINALRFEKIMEGKWKANFDECKKLAKALDLPEEDLISIICPKFYAKPNPSCASTNLPHDRCLLRSPAASYVIHQLEAALEFAKMPLLPSAQHGLVNMLEKISLDHLDNLRWCRQAELNAAGTGYEILSAGPDWKKILLSTLHLPPSATEKDIQARVLASTGKETAK